MSDVEEQADFIFRPQPHLDSKWLHPDLQEALHKQDTLCVLFNSLIQDREIYFDATSGLLNPAGVVSKLGDSGRYYCGLKILTCTCCDGLCGPHSGCPCPPCSVLADEEELRVKNNAKILPPLSSAQLIDDLKWRADLGTESLQKLMESFIWEQRIRALNTAVTCPYISQIRRIIVLCNRHLVAVIREQNQHKDTKRLKPNRKTSQTIGNRTLSNVVSGLNKTVDLCSDKEEDTEDATEDSESALGLARVGARAALRLALSLVRRAWRCGEDADVCSALLRDALDAVRALPDAALFAGADVVHPVPRSQKIWAEVVDSAAKFLHQVVTGEVGCNVPLCDWRTSLCVWVELCARRAELPALLKAADVLLMLPPRQRLQPDNRQVMITLEECTAPLGPFLRRMAKVTIPNSVHSTESPYNNLTEQFLKDLNIPSGDGLVGVKKAGIALVCHLDRLGAPLLPPLKGFVTCMESAQEVINVGMGPVKLGSLRIQQIACAEKLALLLTHDGVVYSLPYDTLQPQEVPGLESKTITQVACHPIGRHYLCCSSDGGTWSWGAGEDGRLGHGDTAPRDAPVRLSLLAHHEVVRVAAGPSCSAVITSRGALYTWGRGSHGSLGHGTLENCIAPQLVSFHAHNIERIIDIALGWGESQTLCCTWEGAVQAFVDTEGGAPRTLTALSGVRVTRVYTGEHFHAVLTDGGQVYTWGKGDGYRLGHDNLESIKIPKLVEALQGVTVVDLSLGPSHGIAISSDGGVYVWGTHERAQISQATPHHLPVLNSSYKAQGAASDTNHVIIWSEESPRDLPLSLPFVIDLSDNTFKLLEKLLRFVVEQCKGPYNASNMKENECLAISCLNLLRIQVHAWECSDLGPVEGDASKWCAGVRSSLVALVEGCAGNGAAAAARSTLAAAWPLLLPTPQMRAHHLISLLPQGAVPASTGARFMTELLVWALLSGSGLQDALRQALESHASDDVYNHLQLDVDYDQVDVVTGQCKNRKNLHSNNPDNLESLQEEYQTNNATSNNKGTSVPLMHLVKQLLRNASCQSQLQMNTITHGETMKTEEPNTKSHDTMSPSCDLLIRFQRLLFCEMMWARGGRSNSNGARVLFAQYAALLAEHVPPTLLAFVKASRTADNLQLSALCDVICSDIVDETYVNSSHTVSKCWQTHGMADQQRGHLKEIGAGSRLIILHAGGREGFVKDSLLIFKSSSTAGRLVSELGVWVCACATRNALAIAGAENSLTRLARACDASARVLPSASRLSAGLLSWPGLFTRAQPIRRNVIRDCDIQNHTKEGGSWIIISGLVYDVAEFDCGNATTIEFIKKFKGMDATEALSTSPHAAYISRITEKCVGVYANDLTGNQSENTSSLTAHHILSSCAFNIALGLSQCGLRLARSLPTQQAERDTANFVAAVFLRGGLQTWQPPNPFEEEKSEARSGTSTGGNSPASDFPLPSRTNRSVSTPYAGIMSHGRADLLLYALAEPKLHDPLALNLWWACERREGNAPHFPPEHPLEELRRALLAALLYHTGLKEHALVTATAEMERGEVKLSPAMSDIVKAVQQSKWSLMRTRQKLSRGYKEVCAGPLERARFLLHEIRAAISPAVAALVSRPPSRRSPAAHRAFRQVMKFAKHPKFVKRFETTKDLRNRQNSLSKSMFKATTLLQGDALLIKSVAGNVITTRSPEDIATVVKPSKVIVNIELPVNSHNLSPKDLANEQTKLKISHNKQLEKDFKNACNLDGLQRSEMTSRCEVKTSGKESNTSDKGQDDKTPTNDLSLSSMNDMTDNSILKGSVESEKQMLHFADDIKNELFTADEEKDDDNSERHKFVNAWVARLGRKEKDLWWMLEEITSEQQSITTAIIDFVISEEPCDIDILRRALYCQMQRAEIRKTGYSIINSILYASQTMADTVKYASLTGILGSSISDSAPPTPLLPSTPLTPPLSGIESVIPYSKYMILLERSKLLDFVLLELKAKVLEGEQYLPLNLKTSANYGAHALLNKPSRASSCLTLLNQIGADASSSLVCNANESKTECLVIYEDERLGARARGASLSGPELASLMKIGTRVVRGKDWKWGDQEEAMDIEEKIESSDSDFEYDLKAPELFNQTDLNDLIRDLGLSKSASEILLLG
ncbi:E3 ubiquitin-protein ligase HERC2 [Eumeta japonica]|uniref:E3 ubiquitin-protein ligase HERC2 n=1 Tax=Eumeta variegata TaxID=151549 RepID=A0A4C1YD30_EUMVA|nr:E3 ubiquitin-protein ligase HERC2 [Eumeta japonica]